MRFKKILVILSIFLIINFAGYVSSATNSQKYNSDVVIKGLSLRISLIQTAYEMYNVNIGNPNYFTEKLYKETSKDAYKHYKWLKATYLSMDDEFKDRLKNIFSSKDGWEYVNAVINLSDDASIYEIIDTLNSNKYLNLSNNLKKDVDKFFTYFYDNYFKKYLRKHENEYIKKANDLNQKLSDNEVDVMSFVENSSGVDIKENYKSIMYYNLNPITSQSFEYDNVMISTISIDTTALDIVSIPFYKYSRSLFDTFTSSHEFLNIYDDLKYDKKFMSIYENFGQDTYTFNDWCSENLISGFSKYLDYKYYGINYEDSSYVYDLDFYNYLKEISFNPNKMSLKDSSINFYKKIINPPLK